MGNPTTTADRNYMRSYLLISLTVLLCIATLITACGGGGRRTPVAPIIPTPPDNTNPAVEEVQNTPLPQGIDAAIWATLTVELVSQLETLTEADRDPIEFNWRDTGVGVSWNNPFMRIDSNNDGIVNVLDLIPLAEHFGEEWNYSEEGPSFADYKSDHVIDFADVAPLAHNYGLACSGFQVEISTESAEAGFAVAGTVAYGDYYNDPWNIRLRAFRFPCETRGLAPLWARVTVLGKNNEALASQVWEAPVNQDMPPLHPPFGNYFGAFMPELLAQEPPAITWNTRYLMPDGNQDGMVNIFDVWALADLWGLVAEDPLRALGDYSGNGLLEMGDVTPAAQNIMSNVDYFVVDLSTTSADEGYAENGTVAYIDSTGFNVNGFRFYEYEIASPPVGVPYWVRVVPFALNDEPGVPSEPVYFEGGV